MKFFNQRLIDQIAKTSKLFIFLDYDGTMTPIVNHPARAILPSKMRRALIKIKNQPNVKVAIISGRSLANIKRLIGLRGIIYAGNHGLEIEGYRFSWVHSQARKFRPLIVRLLNYLHRELNLAPGAKLENKGLGISLHYRLVAKEKVRPLYTSLISKAKPWLDAKKVRLEKGKKVWELKPFISWNKGEAVKWLLRRFKTEGPFFPVFIGDDKTDEDAFKILSKRGITIRVGTPGPTNAQFILNSSDEVRDMLEKIYLKKVSFR